MNSVVGILPGAARQSGALAVAFAGALFLLASPPTRAQEPTVRTTNPSSIDSDGDGYRDGPDMVVERPDGTLVRMLGEDKNGDGKYDPDGPDDVLGTADDEYDPNNPTSHPEAPPESDDTDGDGIPDSREALIQSDPYDIDTDDDGLIDSDEVNGTGLCFVSSLGRSFHTDPSDPDTDADGLPDGLELGVTIPLTV